MSEITEIIREKYDKKANKYDRMMAPMEKMMMAKWRQKLLSQAKGLILEAGVGTGANLPFYPEGAKVIAVDFSSKMLGIAKRKLALTKAQVDLRLADIQYLPFPDNTFDTVITACVFCTVPEPVQGFRELRRVIKPEGKLYFLEHVRSQGFIFGSLMDYLNPWAVKFSGTNINRITEENILLSGMKIVQSEHLFRDIVKLLTVAPNKG
jgi:ubiquinone/menaquinone biosynthesis C-methylase UbiE